MKNRNVTIRCAFFLFILPAFLQGQSNSASAFFNTDTIPATYLGIDFTKAKLINDLASNATTIQSQQFTGINNLMIAESKKYKIQGAYHRSTWNVDLKEVEVRNQKSDPFQLKSSDDSDLYRLNKGDIESLVNNFDYGSNKGYGILLVVEGMSKSKKLITIWFTLVDMDTRNVLFTDRVEGKLGSGFGFRNYWASAIKSSISEVKSPRYTE